jgi:hypothetical protein
MHQHPPHTPLCFSTSRAKSGHVVSSSAFAIRCDLASRGPDRPDPRESTARSIDSVMERHVLCVLDSDLTARCRLVLPVEVRMRDDLLRVRSAPRTVVLRGVRVADERHVEPSVKAPWIVDRVHSSVPLSSCSFECCVQTRGRVPCAPRRRGCWCWRRPGCAGAPPLRRPSGRQSPEARWSVDRTRCHEISFLARRGEREAQLDDGQ